MTLEEFVTNLNEFISVHPEALEFEVLSSIDDEGNGYTRIIFPPSVGFFEDNEFIPEANFKEWDISGTQCNSVCIN